MFQWKVRLTTLCLLTGFVAFVGGGWARFEWLHWSW
jgi:hypothetical protein